LRADREGIVVACGEGALNVTRLQKPGGKAMDVQSFLAGFPVKIGKIFH
jgi:methionyl-tRNA formyltransferase